jgi:EmrB/QacA subfamily drug resistance transporter
VTSTAIPPAQVETPPSRPWPALWALVIGFFMILIDSTIVTIATPAILEDFHAGISQVIWVTSAYLLAYAVPLLITGRLGDRFGPKHVYLAGLFVFTLASLWCGLSGSIEVLILARAVQGLGAALMTPQTMAVITRTFPPQNRGTAMGVWGAVAGVAVLVGPIAGGVIVDSLGWQWIFFVNVPIGVAAFVAAFRLVPRLETHTHSFDIVGVVLSAVAMFLIVFGIQEGERYDWGRIWGAITVWELLAAGVVVLVVFVIWQRRTRAEPLLPLRLFRDRNFSMANLAITAMSFVVTGMGFPMFLYTQTARGLTPTQSALLLTPMAVVSIALAPVVGKLIDKGNPKWFAAAGFTLLAVSLLIYSRLMSPHHSVLTLLIPSALMGVANSGIWSPLSVSATRNLSQRDAGAGAGVYNTTRQVGAVLGSAAIAAVITARLASELPGLAARGGAAQAQAGAVLPAQLVDGFSRAMSQTVLLPAAISLIGVVCALALVRPGVRRGGKHAAGRVRREEPQQWQAEGSRA